MPSNANVPSVVVVADATTSPSETASTSTPGSPFSLGSITPASPPPPGAKSNQTVPVTAPSALRASTSASSAQNPKFDPQETTTYELGGKLDLLRQKLALSAAVYRTEVKNEVEQDPVDQA